MTLSDRSPSGGLKTLTALTGFAAALALGVLALFTVGPVLAVGTIVAIIAAAVLAPVALARRALRAVAVGFGLLLVGAVVVGVVGLVGILSALSDTSGPADPPDAAALAAGRSAVDAAAADNGFRLVLGERELNAVLQEGLAEGDNPFRRVSIDIVNATGSPGRIAFEGDFKNGSLDVSGVLGATVDRGRLSLELLEVEVGMFTIPGVARSAIEDMIGELADLNQALAAEGADVQQIVIGDDRIVVTGTHRGAPIEADAALSNIRRQVDLRGFSIDLEAKFEEGEVAGTSADGSAYYMALGDSLAANVGVDDARDGYVSKFHVQLEIADDRDYGLRNFGVSGETSSSMLTGGQLEAAVEFARINDVRYVTIDVGANDLLGHLASDDCSTDINNEPCLERIGAALAQYERNIAQILDRLDRAVPDATIFMLLTYNPFSFGFETQVEFEAQSNSVLRNLNIIAGEAALERGMVVADGFTPILNTATATTHMLDVPPDIHPNELGYDRLTGALVAALG